MASQTQCRYILLEDFGSKLGGSQNQGISLVEDPHTGIKLICKKNPPDFGVVEASMLKKVEGLPNIIQLHEYLTCQDNQPVGELYIEYCDLGSLGDLYARYSCLNKAISEGFLWHILLSIAKALDACHTGLDRPDWKPILHGDVKLDNILLCSSSTGIAEYPRVVLADFGGAKSVESVIASTDVGRLIRVVSDLMACGERDAGYSQQLKSLIADYEWRYENPWEASVGSAAELVRRVEELVGELPYLT